MTSSASGVKFTRRNGLPWVELIGEIDIAVVDPLADQHYLANETSGSVTVDMRAVTFMDSMGIALLLRLREVAGEGVRLIGPPSPVLQLLNATGLTGMFEVVDEFIDG